MTLADRETLATGTRVRLRGFTREDVDRWQEWPDYAEPLLAGSSPRRISPEQRDAWFQDLIQRQRQIPFAIDDDRGRFIGRLFLRHVRRELGSAVLGIDLHPQVLGQGYGTDALAAFLPHYFDGMGFERLLLSVAAYNERARRSYASLGFRITGSRWDAYQGLDPPRTPALEHLRDLFRRGFGGPETLFYDMALEANAWRAARRFPRGQ